MIVHKCDRCGVEIEDRKKDKNIFDAITDAIKRITTYEITYEIKKCVDGVLEPYTLDLCEKCRDDFKEWLNVPETEERPKAETFVIAKMSDLEGPKYEDQDH